MKNCPTCDRPFKKKDTLSTEQTIWFNKLKKFCDSQEGVPAQQEIAEHMECSLTNVNTRLNVFERKGHIIRKKYHQHSLTFVED